MIFSFPRTKLHSESKEAGHKGDAVGVNRSVQTGEALLCALHSLPKYDLKMRSLVFENVFTRTLPADPQSGSERRQIRNALFSRVEPTPVQLPI